MWWRCAVGGSFWEMGTRLRLLEEMGGRFVLCCAVTSRYGSFLETLFWKEKRGDGDDDDDSNNNTRHTPSSPSSTYITLQKFRL